MSDLFKDVSAYRHQGAGGAGAIRYPLHLSFANGGIGGQSNDIIYIAPFVLSRKVSLSALTFKVVAGAVNAVARGAIYTNTRDTFLYPKLLVTETGSIAAAVAGVKSAAVGPIAIPAGIYWAAVLTGVAVPDIAWTTPQALLGFDPASLTTIGHLSIAFAYAGFPALFPAGAAYNVGTAACPQLWGDFA